MDLDVGTVRPQLPQLGFGMVQVLFWAYMPHTL